ncbi:hypothetical protein CCR75_009824 [Bremia lactucae]|uniref:Uncharacterized protein n=1 Tax=Bremia lactucae TaxID=4779 RepID=A0A976FLL7_BRELC|nr:hypothetical protein CCR75_009824 [Bremia lactucae]
MKLTVLFATRSTTRLRRVSAPVKPRYYVNKMLNTGMSGVSVSVQVHLQMWNRCVFSYVPMHSHTERDKEICQVSAKGFAVI